MAKSVTEASQEWNSKVNEATSKFTSNINSKIASGIGNMFGGKSDGISDNKTYGSEKFHIDPIDFRSKLEVECPDFMKQCGISKVDFGSMFLTPKQEAFIGQAQGITNDVIQSINGVQQFISPAALESVQNMITFIITDLINQVVGYATQTFLKYTSPEFPIGLAKDLAITSLQYTRENTKSPDEVLKEICQEKNKIFEDIKENAEKEAQKTVIGKINKTFSKTTSKIKEIMDEVQPYTQIIAEYMVMGPDYVCSEITAIYSKYLNIGIDYVDTQIRQLEQIVHEYVDYAALSTGLWAADVINRSQEKAAKKIVEKTNKCKAMIELKAKSLINKAIMNLLAQLGG